VLSAELAAERNVSVTLQVTGVTAPRLGQLSRHVEESVLAPGSSTHSTSTSSPPPSNGKPLAAYTGKLGITIR